MTIFVNTSKTALIQKEQIQYSEGTKSKEQNNGA
jgi:hypothetical protein